MLGDKETAIGQYALGVLDRAASDPTFAPGYKDAVLTNTVSYEASVRAALAKVTLGEADASIVYASDVTGTTVGKVQIIDLPEGFTTMAKFYVAEIDDSAKADLAQLFVAYLQTPEAQAILAQYGFMSTK
ncbi:molybdate ABC transporter substrate-binding protein [Chloroflexales bacterium ZM16-3]|nr:molybdate ABC transporter substrate-binding protein [Chloroflexales bacterium ZM16-3]